MDRVAAEATEECNTNGRRSIAENSLADAMSQAAMRRLASRENRFLQLRGISFLRKEFQSVPDAGGSIPKNIRDQRPEVGWCRVNRTR